MKSKSIGNDLALLHFNARSVLNKWDEISAELYSTKPDIVCITKSWCNEGSSLSIYCLNGYHNFFNCRPHRHGGGAMILVRDIIRVHEISKLVSPSNFFNICAVKIFCKQMTLLVAAVYQAPSTLVKETCECFDMLSDMCHLTGEKIIMGDINMPDIDWSTGITSGSYVDLNVKSLLCEFNLTQINAYATRQSNLLDVVIVSPSFLNDNVTQENPKAGSDHTLQRLVVELDALKMENNKQSTKN